MSYAKFEAEIARVNDLLSVVNLLAWDAQHADAAGRRRRPAAIRSRR